MSNSFAYSSSQLIYISPLLAAYLVGIILALLNMSRYPRASSLALVGCALMFVTSLGRMFIQSYIFTQYRSSGWTAQTYATALNTLAICANLFHVAGFGLLLGGVFAGRGAIAAGFPVDYPAAPSFPPPQYPPAPPRYGA
jgi:hypothetical protein